MREGYRLYREIHARLNLPVLETGAMVLAWNAEELGKLPGIVAQAHENGVRDVGRSVRRRCERASRGWRRMCWVACWCPERR